MEEEKELKDEEKEVEKGSRQGGRVGKKGKGGDEK